MRQVMARPWNDLGEFLGPEPCPRGCMVGTYVLLKNGANKLATFLMRHDRLGWDVGGDYVVQLLNRRGWGAPRTIAVLKQRIRKSLGLAPLRSQESMRTPRVDSRGAELWRRNVSALIGAQRKDCNPHD